MARSIFDPSNIDSSIKKLASAKGTAFHLFYGYLADPLKIQSIPARPHYKWYLRNLRSDLSSWRTALAQVPPSRLLTIPWLALLADSRHDLANKPEPVIIATLMENIRLYTTQLLPSELLIGNYNVLNSNHIPTAFNATPAPLPDPAGNNFRPLKKEPEPTTPLHVPLPFEKRIETVSDTMKSYLVPSTQRKGFISTPESYEPEEEVDDLAPLLVEQKALQNEQLELLTHDAPSKVRLKEIDTRLTQIKKLIDNQQ